MRVSPVTWIPGKDLEWVLHTASASASVTHNHPEGVKGAQATAAAMNVARTGQNKELVREFIADRFDYDLERTVEEIRPTYTFSSWAATSVPEAIVAFLDSSDFEDCIRLAISLGGDSDTIAAIAGSIAQAYYREIPPRLAQGARQVLDPLQSQVLNDFCETFGTTALAECPPRKKEKS